MQQPTDFLALNSQLNIYDQNGQIQFDKDREAARQYFLQHVNPNTVFFHSLEEKLRYLVENEYYEEEFLSQYSESFVKNLYKRLYAKRFRFSTFVGAYKFYTGYALKTFDGQRYLERYEDRIAAVALYLARGDEKLARDLADEMINQRFQPATPTFLNAGKKQRGELVSCFPGDACVSLPDGSQRFIKDIKEGDQVLADDGSSRRVTGIMSRETDEGLMLIKLEGMEVPLRCTPEHPLLALTKDTDPRLRSLRIPALDGEDGSDENHAWVEAQHLSPGDFVAVDRSGAPGDLYMPWGKLVAKIESIEHQAWTGTVHNLEVEERHTYVVEDVVVHNCYLIDIADDMNSIGRAINSSLQLSKRGGGVALNLTNLRAVNDPIKNIENQSSGIIPVMKLLENCFSYANQLGARQGAGAVYLNAHHLDIQDFLDCRREAADEKIRIKTLSLGVVIPDITFELAQRDEDMYLFSPYDVSKKYGKPFSQINITEVYRELVEDPNIRKSKMNARRFFQQLAEVQFESGYPYILFEDNANRANNVAGKIVMSNLCVTGDTELLTDQGLVSARELYEQGKNLTVGVDERTRSFDPQDRGVSPASAIPMHLTARQADVFEVQTQEGFSLKATEWHKMYVLREGEVRKVPLAELNEGDRILVQSGRGLFGSKHEPEAAYLAGVAAGDGTFGKSRTGEPVIKYPLYGEKMDLREPIEKAAATLLAAKHKGPVHHSSTLTPRFADGSADPNCISMSSAPLTEALSDLGFTKQTKRQVPRFVKLGDQETVSAYLQGLFQTDATISGSSKTKALSVELAQTDRTFLQEIQRVLINLGVFSRIYRTRGAGTSLLPDGKGGQAEYPTETVWSLRVMDRVSRERLLGLISMRAKHMEKFERLSSELQPVSRQPKHQYTATVTAIEYAGKEDVYDTTVDETNSVIFNGIVTGQCSEILQVSEASLINDRQEYEVLGKDISCNLGSLNVSQVMDGSDIGKTVESAIRALTTVSDLSDITTVPTIQSGNQRSHAVGLGQMNLHGFLARERIHYGSRESLDFTNMYFYLMAFHTVRASAKIAKETGVTFDGYEDSKYASGEYFEKYINGDWTPKTAKVRKLFEKHHLPGPDDWKRLAAYVKKHGMYHQNLQAVAPTGSISYVNHATASIHPITSKIEVRKEGKMGMVCYPAAHLTNDNLQYYKDAYELGWKAVIDVYAEATKHVDQGLSMTLFFTEEATTRDINKAQIYAWKKGIKTIYYIRVKSAVLEGTDTEGCVSCAV